jgi:hypothetical protein
MPAQLEVVYDGLATQIERARVVRRIKVRDDKDFHPNERLMERTADENGFWIRNCLAKAAKGSRVRSIGRATDS